MVFVTYIMVCVNEHSSILWCVLFNEHSSILGCINEHSSILWCVLINEHSSILWCINEHSNILWCALFRPLFCHSLTIPEIPDQGWKYSKECLLRLLCHGEPQTQEMAYKHFTVRSLCCSRLDIVNTL